MHLGAAMGDLIPNVGAGTLLESLLLSDERAVRIGAIQALDYDRAVVITHDRWKADTGGIPQYSFLLATAREVGADGGDDDEVLLLRVEGTAPLTLEKDLLGVREEALRDALSRHGSPSPSVVLDLDMDPFTKNRISFTGLNCRILGTFYEQVEDGHLSLHFGHDVDNFYATSTYRVFKPVGDGLAEIASYLKPSDDPIEQVRIGAVRYSSTRRRAIASGQNDAAVKVNVHDFIGNKTGMFGMTRMGKSNTMKTVVSRIFVVSEKRRSEGGSPVGQLIFDPQGEYANPNTQDGKELAAIGEKHVVIYKFGGTGDSVAANVRPLGFNFFDPAQIDAVKGVISTALVDASSDYVKSFVQADFSGTAVEGETAQDGKKREIHAARGRLLLYGALRKADFSVPQKDSGGLPWRAWISMRKELVAKLESDLGAGRVISGKYGSVGVERDYLTEVIDWIVERSEAQDLSGPAAEGLASIVDGDAWKSALPIYTQRSGNRMVSGYTKLKSLKGFHAPTSRADYRNDIYRELQNGRIVIMDLHLGPEKVIRSLSENLAASLMDKQTEVFTSGKTPPDIQIVIEEAHNLFSSDKYKDDLDVWVRLAKEASKLKVGMIYATQEVTGVAHQVLANTKNWVVAHLNNTREVNELARFYDFKAFGDSIISHEDKGYVRLKTMSSPFIVPVHIDKYGAELVNEAREAAGEPPLPVQNEQVS
ncbi:helicase HerA domain-containing protein [Streptomyces sp. NPDC017435]|uniref:helicase HerA domain-containing protein n=1 Tax=Streptomyces sp. NPDC017435 TaxID=3364995 RepID=UPI0037992B9E